jgi:hypothetical protein
LSSTAHNVHVSKWREKRVNRPALKLMRLKCRSHSRCATASHRSKAGTIESLSIRSTTAARRCEGADRRFAHQERCLLLERSRTGLAERIAT